MNVEFDQTAKQWIQGKGGQLTVKTLNVRACCAPGVQEVVAVPGKPGQLEPYNELKVNGISLYMEKNLCAKEKLVLKLSGVGFLKSISAKLQ